MVSLDRLRQYARWAAAIGTLCALAGVGACSSMKTIDRKIDRSMRERSGNMGTISPDVEHQQPSLTTTVDPYDREPATRNPGADELPYQSVDPDEDVLKRLEHLYDTNDPQVILDLEKVFQIAQTSSREYRTAEEDYIFVAIRFLIQKHQWGPRFFDDVTAEVPATSNNGDYSVALNVINELRVTQRLPYGGNVEARLVSEAAHQLVTIVGERTQRSGELILAANVPLLRNAGLIAQEDLIQSQRDLVYAARAFERFRREFLVSIAQDYFSLVTQKSNIENQQTRLANVIKLLDQRTALVEAGRQAAFEARNVEQNVARSRSSLAGSQDSYQLAKDRFKVRLGLPVETDLDILAVSLTLPEPAASVTEAAQLALKYRLDYQNAVDRIGDRKRAVANAKNQILPSLDVSAVATFGNDLVGGGDFGPAFDLEDTDYQFGVTFGLPLDREIERLNLRQATVLLERAERTLAQTRDNLIVEARASVRETIRAQFSLKLQEQAIEINLTRIEQLLIDQENTTAQQQLDAQDNLLQSQNDRDQALQDLRIAILNYLLSTGQMRVAPDGTFQPLQGMIVQYETLDQQYETPGADQVDPLPAGIPRTEPGSVGEPVGEEPEGQAPPEGPEPVDPDGAAPEGQGAVEGAGAGDVPPDEPPPADPQAE